MKNNSITRIILCIVLLISTVSFIDCSQQSSFSGDSTGNDHQFLLDFSILNTTESNQMYLQKGEQINTSIEITKGTVDIIVKDEAGKVAYEGNNVNTSNFTIGIDETGKYTFDVTGKNAKGSVHFEKGESNQG
ncbi:MAG: hypothetical protein Q4G58_12295 [bacterium]|nr:hypothetical protein [bacterium]